MSSWDAGGELINFFLPKPGRQRVGGSGRRKRSNGH